MAALAKTSRMNVTIDLIMVLLVLYCAPIGENLKTMDLMASTIHYDTVFIGLGVLSFAFVCQHSAFIIAGSLEKPTKDRWSTVTSNGLSFCVCLALLCGSGGYIGYQEKTQGNILNSLDDSLPANVARGLLGFTMLFVYPMESFVARHVCVVLFFEGRSAHEGDDTSVLNRRDRRITLTFLLYLIAVIPAGIFQNLGTVLASCGAVGGSCLSYIGPGMVYLGIHGARFLELTKTFFGEIRQVRAPAAAPLDEEEAAPLYNVPEAVDLPSPPTNENWIVRQFKNMLWYLWLMPIWCKIATIGKATLTNHVTELALKSPHPIRIGNVRFASTKVKGGSTRVLMLPSKGSSLEDQRSSAPIDTMLLHSDSVPGNFGTTRTIEGKIVALPLTPNQTRLLPPSSGAGGKNYQSINAQVGALAKRKKQEEELALEDDPQQDPPGVYDFVIAILYIIFGVVAMTAGLFSIYNKQ
jgi:hypothetical protein